MTSEVPSELHTHRRHVERIAWLLDNAVPIPGTRWRVGLDSLLGLLPGVGDTVGLAMGATLIYKGLRIGVPRPLLLHMLRNAALDWLGGLLPGVGDLFDFAFKSNQRNARLLLEHLDRVERREQRAASVSRLRAALLTAPVLLLFAALVAISVTLWLR